MLTKSKQYELDGELIRFSGLGHLEIVKYLVAQGADVRAKDDYALCWAASNGHLEVAKYLEGIIREKTLTP